MYIIPRHLLYSSMYRRTYCLYELAISKLQLGQQCVCTVRGGTSIYSAYMYSMHTVPTT
jgi:hypothetical protein